MALPEQLDPVDVRLIDLLQGGFPLLPQPFARTGAQLELTEASVIRRLQNLLDKGVLTRFGPMYQIEQLGGRFVLAALAVPEARFDWVAAAVNALPAVAHNYRREHQLNMWFVLAADSQAGINAACRRIETQTGLPVHAFPKEREYFVGMSFRVGGRAPVGACQTGKPHAGAVVPLDAVGRRLIEATQAGLPLCPQPYLAIARQLEISEAEVTGRLAGWLDNGVIRRIGAVPNHYAIGYRANGMAVFNVDDARVDALGMLLGRQAAVSHCYRRPRHLPGWPYNLFAMLHGPDRSTVCKTLEDLHALLGDACLGHDILFSTGILKKTGMRL
ncbi:siroheme decarboxylase subunit beta [Laribacter hongkongensis]|uniref:siroheme decarboxylase n=1 Tax=Laribacter hongkongensis TaxID=168471 RepID=A0A248LHU9_9NEIS|nr:Lrp/AsnC family transcriptional regulator [Laribacter hongkongensis]ASJ24360.1 AsnC family transcriptional regulator [Laribacter hongkongensis]MCG9042037.1 Lrp/AsnC family transcriptional regulator [Laribacter hongkongensis]MCG9069073.1 Lrp/AsnC family transcriptional regulator [Laribacter hongkongensis]MCG9087880.1 Lrp/AsnC family transcriptional regulator [Laribacter hongkongensis]MCG9110741.1 Lrp/AsnC family transcriptional regulator [Laribacter hongkongensis]